MLSHRIAAQLPLLPQGPGMSARWVKSASDATLSQLMKLSHEAFTQLEPQAKDELYAISSLLCSYDEDDDTSLSDKALRRASICLTGAAGMELLSRRGLLQVAHDAEGVLQGRFWAEPTHEGFEIVAANPRFRRGSVEQHLHMLLERLVARAQVIAAA